MNLNTLSLCYTRLAAILMSSVAVTGAAKSLDLVPVRIVGAAVVYIDPASIKRTPGRAQVWSLWNFATKQINVYDEPYRSARFLNDYDCGSRTVRIVEIHEYSDSFGKGSPLRSYGGEGLNERSVPRGSVGDQILEQVCSPAAEVNGNATE